MTDPYSLNSVQKKNKTQKAQFKSLINNDTEESLVKIGRKPKLAEKKMEEITNMIKEETTKHNKEESRTVVAEELSSKLNNTPIGDRIEYKVYHHGECITYLDIIKFEIKIGRVKISQGRNEAVTLCFERYDTNGARYIKLYTHDEFMKHNKKNGGQILDNFSKHIFLKYIA